MSEKYVKLDDVLNYLEQNKDMLGFEVVYDAILYMPTVELPQWHDLRENPDDLPETMRECVIICSGRASGLRIKGLGFYFYGDGNWHIRGVDLNLWKPIKWCELPKDNE